MLPFDIMDWEDFERIQLRILRDVEGLRHTHQYGDQGQKQFGVDVAATSARGLGVALQSKRKKRFGPAELTAAVRRFLSAPPPFEVSKFIIGVSREIKSTRTRDCLRSWQADLRPLEVELWDMRELSDRLRDAPEIVITFFGEATAERFCLPFERRKKIVPNPQTVRVREAIARTPEKVTGAADLLDRSASCTDSDPEHALELVSNAQQLLQDAGFRSYATLYQSQRNGLLVDLGRIEEAARIALDDFWAALDRGSIDAAEFARRKLHELKRGANGDLLAAPIRVANCASALYQNPLGEAPDATTLALGENQDRIRLAILAGEMAIANLDAGWLELELPKLAASINVSEESDEVLTVRFRLLLAEATDEWTQLLNEARKRRLGHEVSALVTARYARRCALVQDFQNADDFWDEATGDACLAERWKDAAGWILSRRSFLTKWNPFKSNELLPLQIAVRDMGPSDHLIPADEDAHEAATIALSTGKNRSAAISAQRALRDAIALANWSNEEKARRTLASVFIESGEPELAARHLIHCSATKLLCELSSNNAGRFLDMSEYLNAPNYWTVASTYLLLSEQADLIPDEMIDRISHVAIDDAIAIERGETVDLPMFSNSRYQNAIKLIAGVSPRIGLTGAEKILAHFERQPEIDDNHYRYHDDDEARIVSQIAMRFDDLRSRAVAHLVALLGRSQTARKAESGEAIDKNIVLARPLLDELADLSNDWAMEVLAFHDPSRTSDEAKAAAFARLTTPLQHEQNTYTTGTNAIGDSILISDLDAPSIASVVQELMDRVGDPHVAFSDRGDYLVAVSNLALKLDLQFQNAYFDRAMKYVANPEPSELDTIHMSWNHPLGSMRWSDQVGDSRDKALFLAASLANSEEQREAVKNRALALIALDGVSDYWIARVLQRVGATLTWEIGFLSSQSWALRSLASLLWVENDGASHIGYRLSQDGDVRVRRALARALSKKTVGEEQLNTASRLSNDVAFSVRRALTGE